MKKYIVIGFLYLVPMFALAETVAYCDDKAVIQDWEKMAQKYQHSDNWQRLHAVWLGLCDKVRNGGISEKRAHRLFEEERERTKRLEEPVYIDPTQPFG